MNRWAVALLLLLVSPLTAQTIRLGTTDQLAPFAPGIEALFRDAGVTAQVERLPYVRIFAMLRTHDLDGVFFVPEVGLPETPGLRPLPVVLYRNEYLAVAIRSDVVVRLKDDLKRYVVAIERGNFVQENLTEGVAGLVRTADQKTSFLMLASGRVDVALASRAALPSLLAVAGITNAYVQEPPLESQPLYLALMPSADASRPALTKVFQAALDDGRWARLVQDGLRQLYPRR